MFVLPLLLDCQQSRLALSNITSPRGWWGQDPQAPAPYGCPDCRCALYRVLLCCILVDNHLLAAPLHHAIGVFTTGLQDPNMQVRGGRVVEQEKGVVLKASLRDIYFAIDGSHLQAVKL